eukprot:5073168-Alexandrium_andersonii.AAC.1
MATADIERLPPAGVDALQTGQEPSVIYLLHLFSGFRRPGDLQAQFDSLSACPFKVEVHSVDIEISDRMNLLDEAFV